MSESSAELIKKKYVLMAAPLVRNLEKRQFEAHYCATKEEALAKALELIPHGSVVTWGGVMSAGDIRLKDALMNGDCHVMDRDGAPTPEAKQEIMIKAFSADVFITSFNAVSEDGVLINIDGNGNRVAAICCGPKSVVAIVGMNKVCRTVDDALERARNVAAPLNCLRFGKTDTPCTKSGLCGNCTEPGCICSEICFFRMCHVPKRIKIILVGEDLGY